MKPISNSRERQKNVTKISTLETLEPSNEILYNTRIYNRKKRSIKNRVTTKANKYWIILNLILILIPICFILIKFLLLNKYLFSKNKDNKKIYDFINEEDLIIKIN